MQRYIQTIGYCFVSIIRLYSIISFNIRLLAFVKLVEYLKSSTFKTGLIIYLSHAENTLKSRLNFNETQAKYAYKRYTYKKRAY